MGRSLAVGVLLLVLLSATACDGAAPTTLTAQLQRWPGIVAVLYFDADRGCPRWVDSSASSLAAFRAMGAEPYFNAPTTVAIP